MGPFKVVYTNACASVHTDIHTHTHTHFKDVMRAKNEIKIGKTAAQERFKGSNFR